MSRRWTEQKPTRTRWPWAAALAVIAVMVALGITRYNVVHAVTPTHTLETATPIASSAPENLVAPMPIVVTSVTTVEAVPTPSVHHVAPVMPSARHVTKPDAGCTHWDYVPDSNGIVTPVCR